MRILLAIGRVSAELCRVLKPLPTMKLPDAKLAFRRALRAWFGRQAKDYPWRRTTDPYAILVSEVMLQQTQIATVLGKAYYTRFLQAFPDVERLATAGDEDLLKAWEGLGYYRRARMLRETARAVRDDHGGRFPEALDELLRLPGVGRYTAGALRAFAFGKPAVLVDGNVARVLARLMDFHAPVDDSSGGKQLWDWAALLADDRHPREYHAALMELGQQICRPKSPDCLACPVAMCCKSSEPALLPVKGRKVQVTEIAEHALWLRDSGGRLLMHHEQGRRRTGLWKLPLREAAELGALPVIGESKYGITRYRVTLKVHDGGIARDLSLLGEGDRWVTVDELAGLAMAAPFRKMVERLIVDF